MQKLSGCSSAPRYLARTHCSRHKPNFQHFKFALESFSSFKRKYESTSSFKRNYDSQIEPRDATRCRCSTALSPQTADNIPEHSAEDSIEQNQNFNGAVKWFYAFFKFTRPHTMLGTLVSIVSVSLLALGPHEVGWKSLVGLLQALIPALFMNIHIVGLNQVFDVNIDKVNKPYLPLASGEFSMPTALSIVSISGIIALVIGVLVGSFPLMLTLLGSATLGLAYSVDLPLLRWKRSPVLAACCILAVRAVLVQLGFYFHMRQYMGDNRLILTRPLLFTVSFMLFFSIVIALFKDIPDVKGDSQAGLRTLSVRAGTRRVFWLCISLLEIAYLGAITTGIASSILWSRIATVAAHIVLGSLLMKKALKTDLDDSKQIYHCYMYVWKLFYAEYLLIPLLR